MTRPPSVVLAACRPTTAAPAMPPDAPEPTATEALLRWCEGRTPGREARDRRVPALFEAFEALFPPSRPIVTVAGTSGKGTTCALLDAALLAAGHPPGVITKPHLHHVRERFSVGGRHVSATELDLHAASVHARLRALVAARGAWLIPSFYEATLLVGASLFAARGASIVVVEASIGGANDASSFLPAALSVLTSVDLDHTAELGGSLDAIARDKAAIARPGATLVLGAALTPDARAVARAVCAARAVRALDASPDCVRVTHATLSAQSVELRDGDALHTVTLPFAGRFQAQNLATAWVALGALRALGLVHFADADALRGVARASLPGRCELIAGTPSWLCDVAHNPAALAALIDTVREHLAPASVVVLLGATAPHDATAFVRLVRDWNVQTAFCDGFTRATDARQLAADFDAPARCIGVFHGASEAVDGLLRDPALRGRTVVVTGSLFLVGAVRDALCRRGILRDDRG